MKVIIFGATGMVGQGVLRECLRDPDVKLILTIGRAASGQHHPKLRELVQQNLFDFSTIEPDLLGFDSCFFCLGVSSSGMTEDAYRRITYGITLAAAEVLAKFNPNMTFIYVSGQGTDSTERGRAMWARVKGQTENALLRLPLQAYMFRPGIIQPRHGIVSKTKVYRIFYVILGPLLPALKAVFPSAVTTTEQIGRAMLKVAKRGAPKRILETADINSL
jgi:uncharacterized protein YbjT (DUF2867 family)